jgi:ATP-dependent Lhr-like helicase
VIESLVEDQRLIADFLAEGSISREICDRVNLERLLRLLRRERRQPLRTLPVSVLPLFLALHQGISMDGMSESGGAGVDDRAVDARDGALRSGLERLFGYPGKVESWESAFLPARVPAYAPELLDLLLQRSDLIWFGAGRRRIGFCLSTDLELFPSPALDVDEEVDRLFPDRQAKYGFQELLRRTEMGPGELSSSLWELVWRGVVSNDRFELQRPVRTTAYEHEGQRFGQRAPLPLTVRKRPPPRVHPLAARTAHERELVRALPGRKIP